MSAPSRLLACAALLAALAAPLTAPAQVAPPEHSWSFQMLAGADPVGQLVIDLGVFMDNALPAVQLIDISGLVTNSTDPANATVEDSLVIIGSGTGFSSLPPDIDGTPFFTDDPGYLLAQIMAGDSLPILLGQFDAAAFLAALAADGSQHTATIDFELWASAVDANGDFTGEPFDPNWPSIVPGPPSVIILARVDPSTPGPIVPEPSSLAMLAGAGLVGFGAVARRRRR